MIVVLLQYQATLPSRLTSSEKENIAKDLNEAHKMLDGTRLRNVLYILRGRKRLYILQDNIQKTIAEQKTFVLW